MFSPGSHKSTAKSRKSKHSHKSGQSGMSSTSSHRRRESAEFWLKNEDKI